MRREPALIQSVSIFCLLFVAAAASVSGAAPGTFPANAARTSAHAASAAATPATRTHRRTGLSAWGDPTKKDVAEYDDPAVRQIAVDALGHANGSVVAVDPATGRILTVVNQKLAFSAGFEPCSTIKPVVALAGLQQGVITRDTMIKVGRGRYMDLTEAMAHSNNKFFEEVGEKLGFDQVLRYARTVGLGERVG